MNETNRTEEFLAAATAGLKHDRELQLDVQAELRSHLEERRSEAEAGGLGADAATDEAVRAMGPAAELAADLERANHRRMRLRALIRLAAQWLLAPLAVAVAVLTTDWGTFQVVRLVEALGGNDNALFQQGPGVRHGLTPEQQLVLYGDRTRKTTIEQQRAIWEKWPASKVYLHNHLTYLVARDGELGAKTPERDAAFAAEVAKLQSLDPDNARFDYLLAGRLLDQAVETKSREVKGPDGKSKAEYDTVVKDRAKLDAAMAHFKAGLAKPEFRRYTRELAVERLAILGEPTSLLQEISEIALIAGVLLPDLAHLRNLARTTVFYGELLANEGRREEADLFLNAYRRFVPQLSRDSFTLIDVLVVGAIAGVAADRVPAVYDQLGDTAAAERARAETTALAAPLKQWKEKRQAADKTPAGQAWATDLRRHGGILAGLLLPALGEYPTPAELAPGRHLEYVVAEGLALGVLSVGLTELMLGFVLMAFCYRWVRGGGPGTLQLLPEASEVVRVLSLGVLLPLLLFYLFTRWLPWNGRDLSLSYGWPQFLVQLLTLFLVMMGMTLGLAGRTVRRRCRELLLPVAPASRTFWRVAGWSLIGILVSVLLSLLCLFVSLWIAGALNEHPWMGTQDPKTQVVVFWYLALPANVLLLFVAVAIGYGIVRDVRFGRSCAAYYGSLARTLIPVVALALILVSVCSRPYLRMEERRLLRSDRVMRIDPNGGFTVVESRVTQRLKAEIQQAAGKLTP